MHLSKRIFVVMGVSGSGKTTVARALAQCSKGVFLDADDFHPLANREKMAAGIPLDDDDRQGWLEVLHETLVRHNRNDSRPLFLACSALKQSYRDILSEGLDSLLFLHLNGSYETILQRMAARTDHFMPPELLQSQFEILEEPEDALWFDVVDSVEVITEKFLRQFPELRMA
ncbi:MAG: gluconokinase [Candidatus Methylacidiphilales bacterium]